MTERWLPCPGYEGLYEVSNLGRVRSLHFEPPRILKFGTDQTDYPIVALSKNGSIKNGGTRKTFTVHRLVAIAFHGHKRNALHNEVAHLDGNRKNASADNLKWVSKVENMSHKLLHGTDHRGSKHPHAILNEGQVIRILDLLVEGYSCNELAKQFGVKGSTIDCILKGKNWRHVPRPMGFSDRKFRGQAGTMNHNAKFTEAEVLDIRRRRESGETCKSIGDRYGVWKGTISRIARGVAYARAADFDKKKPA
jgi:hypothetical protein